MQTESNKFVDNLYKLCSNKETVNGVIEIHNRASSGNQLDGGFQQQMAQLFDKVIPQTQVLSQFGSSNLGQLGNMNQQNQWPPNGMPGANSMAPSTGGYNMGMPAFPSTGIPGQVASTGKKAVQFIDNNTFRQTIDSGKIICCAIIGGQQRPGSHCGTLVTAPNQQLDKYSQVCGTHGKSKKQGAGTAAGGMSNNFSAFQNNFANPIGSNTNMPGQMGVTGQMIMSNIPMNLQSQQAPGLQMCNPLGGAPQQPGLNMGFNPNQQQQNPLGGAPQQPALNMGFNPNQQQQNPLGGAPQQPALNMGFNPNQQQNPLGGAPQQPALNMGFNPNQQQNPLGGAPQQPALNMGFNPNQQQNPLGGAPQQPALNMGFNPNQQQQNPLGGAPQQPALNMGFNPNQQQQNPLGGAPQQPALNMGFNPMQQQQQNPLSSTPQPALNMGFNPMQQQQQNPLSSTPQPALNMGILTQQNTTGQQPYMIPPISSNNIMTQSTPFVIPSSNSNSLVPPPMQQYQQQHQQQQSTPLETQQSALNFSGQMQPTQVESVGQLSGQFSNMNVTSPPQQIQSQTGIVFTRKMGDRDFIFNSDMLASGLVFENINGIVTCIGKILNTVNNDGNQLPPDFMTMINQNWTLDNDKWLSSMGIPKIQIQSLVSSGDAIPEEFQATD
jgi:hypothetical protein